MINVIRQELRRNGERVGLGDIALPGQGPGPGLVVDQLPVIMQDDRITEIAAHAQEVHIAIIAGWNDIGVL